MIMPAIIRSIIDRAKNMGITVHTDCGIDLNYEFGVGTPWTQIFCKNDKDKNAMRQFIEFIVKATNLQNKNVDIFPIIQPMLDTTKITCLFIAPAFDAPENPMQNNIRVYINRGRFNPEEIADMIKVVDVKHKENKTIVYFSDGTRVMTACDSSKHIDPISGFCIAVCQKYMGEKEFEEAIQKYCQNEQTLPPT